MLVDVFASGARLSLSLLLAQKMAMRGEERMVRMRKGPGTAEVKEGRKSSDVLCCSALLCSAVLCCALISCRGRKEELLASLHLLLSFLLSFSLSLSSFLLSLAE